MFADLDETIRRLLIRDVPLDPAEVDVNLEAPDRDWSGRLSRPAVNCFLYDVRENHRLRVTEFDVRRAGQQGVKAKACLRMDATYQLSAWTRAPEDEHRLLWRVLVALARCPLLPAELLQGALAGQPYPVPAQVAQPEQAPRNPADLWQVIDNRMTCFVNRLPGEIRPAGASAESAGRDGHGARGASDVRALPVAQVALPGRGPGAATTLQVTAADPGTTVEVRPPDNGAPEEQFTLVARRGESEEVFPNLSLGRGRSARNVVEVVNRESKLVQLAEQEAGGTLAERAPAAGTYALAPSSPAPMAIPQVNPNTFIGDAAERTGINGLELLDEVTMVAVPDVMAALNSGQLDEEGVRAVQTALIGHCEAMRDRVAIIDAPPGLSPQQIREWRQNTAGYDSKLAALYYPWIQIANPVANGSGPASLLVPPSGHMAGLWARNDGERGVHKAPANEVVRGAIGLEKQISRNEQDSLNPVGVNCIRAFPGRGIRVWGARTLSSDPSWRYLNVRRLFNFVEKSIDTGTQWVVFEPNDYYLWEKVTRDVGAFLTRVWQDGAHFGGSPAEAYYVKCDEELNPSEVRDAGQLVVEVGIAPVKPAEFVIFRISQFSPQAA